VFKSTTYGANVHRIGKMEKASLYFEAISINVILSIYCVQQDLESGFNLWIDLLELNQYNVYPWGL